MRSLYCYLTIFTLSLTFEVQSQEYLTLRGIILNENDETPIFNAHIYLRGSATIGTTTNENGEFRLHIKRSNNNTEIEISCLGFKPRAIRIDPSSIAYLRIRLKEEKFLLDEIVVSPIEGKKILSKATENLHQNYNQEMFKKTLYYKEFFKSNGEAIQYLEIVADLTSSGFNRNRKKLNYDICIKEKKPSFSYSPKFNGANGISVLHWIYWTQKYLRKSEYGRYDILYEGISHFKGHEVYHLSINDLVDKDIVTSMYITTDSHAIIAIKETFIESHKEITQGNEIMQFLEATQYVDFKKDTDGYWYISSIDDYRKSLHSNDSIITEINRHMYVSSIEKIENGKKNACDRKIHIRTNLYNYPTKYDEKFWRHFNAPMLSNEERKARKELIGQ